jgi:predicted solute-binding protein
MKNKTLFLFALAILAFSCDLNDRLNKKAEKTEAKSEVNVQIAADVKAGKDYYYEYELNFPVFSGSNENTGASDVFNKEIANFIANYTKEFEGSALTEKKEIVDVILKEDNLKPEDNHMYYSLTIKYLPPHETVNGILSVKFIIDEFNLGAHPNIYFKTFNFDLKKSQFLKLEDILDLSTPEKKKAVNSLLSKYLEDPYDCFDVEPTTDIEEMQFSLTDEHLVFSYQPYLLGAYACGSTTILVPITELKNIGVWKN